MAIFDAPLENIVHRLGSMRKYLTTGPCGQSSSVLQMRSEIASVCRAAEAALKERDQAWREMTEEPDEGQ